MEPEDPLKGNEAAQLSRCTDDATAAQTYATLALAHEMRANTLAIIWSSPATGNDVVERAGKELARLLSWVEI